jgi:hypothetical protein
MSKTLKLPPELHDARDVTIEQAWNGPPLPIDFDLTQWLEVDGRSDMMDLWDDWAAYSLDELSDRSTDGEVPDEEGMDEEGVVTDAARLIFAREQIGYVTGGDDESHDRSVHVVPLVREDGKSVVVGCLVQIQGQGGFGVEWIGAFPTRSNLLLHLKAAGYLTTSEGIGCWRRRRTEPRRRRTGEPPVLR